MTFQIRDATLNDRTEIIWGARNVYDIVDAQGGVQARWESQLARLTESFDSILSGKVPGVALVVGRPVQAFTLWAVTDPEPHPVLGLYAEALCTWVTNDLRQKGVASTLYRTARERLHALGVRSVVALTETTNAAMQRMLAKQGFSTAQLVYTAPVVQPTESEE